ncbi:MAG: hypothetical protein C0618_06270 [Desulfuromonas sp.]|nr:MAG: hypothetical protein C0618_06270 [Desulfuromonas sp.]
MGKIRRSVIFFMTLSLVSCLMFANAFASEAPDDDSALAGLNMPAKAFFDINIGASPETYAASMEKLALYLDVIGQTYDSLMSQGADPDIIVVFRGAAVTLVTENASEQVKVLIAALAKKQIKFEACNVATTLTGTPNTAILPQVKVVGNTFVSAIGYQSAGYRYIIIQ